MRLLVFSFLLVSGCASYLSRGDHFLENGDYDDAIAMYEHALKHGNPDNARIGLQKARDGWLGKKLIDVRLLRLSGSSTQANDVLNEVLEKEAAWDQVPAGAAFSTQQEESEFAAGSVLESVKKSLAENKTLAAARTLEMNRGFFQTNRKADLTAIERSMRAQGSSNCAKLTKQIRPTDYYFGLFTQRYCSYFGGRLPDLSVQKKREVAHLYSDLDVAMTGVAADSRLPSMMKEIFFQELRTTPWFDTQGASKLKVTTATKFTSTHETEATTALFQYPIQVPKTTERTEHRYDPKDRKASKHDDSFTLFDGIGAVLKLAGAVAGIGLPSLGTSEHDNGDGTVTITETHYETEYRTVPYPAIDHRQVFTFASTAKLELDGLPVEVSIAKNFEHHALENHTSLPDVGLAPKEPDLMSEDEWSRAQIQSASTILKLKVMNAWDRKYCADAPNVSADLVFKCWHSGSTHLPSTFTNWFSTTFGVTPEQSEQLLGVVKI